MIPGGPLEDPPLRGFVRNRIWANTWCPFLHPCHGSVGWIGSYHNWKGSVLICNPIRWKEEARNRPLVLSPVVFITRAGPRAHLEPEHGLTKHRLHKINASRLLLVQVSLREASDLNYQECCIGSSKAQSAPKTQRQQAACLRDLQISFKELVRQEIMIW